MHTYQDSEKKLAGRFFRYAKIDTQSDGNSHSFPSTAKQKDLGHLLVKELLEMGIADAALDAHGYVYATIPATTDKKAPVICFCAHMDTSPDCSGQNVKPILHYNYQGKDLVLPDDPSVIIRLNDHPDLSHQLGNDIITASGTTLLGADNKAGITAIMEAAQFLISNRDIPHGVIKILFTPDEEIGRGVDKVDLEKLGADFGYTIDGETLGSIEDETFSADGLSLTVFGVSAHPGFARGKMESAIKILSRILAALPDDCSPEHTEGMQGFVHPVGISGSVEQAEAQFILRDFDTAKLDTYEGLVESITKKVLENFPGTTYKLVRTEQYRNMKMVLDKYPKVVEYGIEAIKRAGITPIKQSIRGGTDGTRLSFMGLPCPNIFAGEHAFHGKEEWVSVQDMEKAAATIVHLAVIWAEKPGLE